MFSFRILQFSIVFFAAPDETSVQELKMNDFIAQWQCNSFFKEINLFFCLDGKFDCFISQSVWYSSNCSLLSFIAIMSFQWEFSYSTGFIFSAKCDQSLIVKLQILYTFIYRDRDVQLYQWIKIRLILEIMIFQLVWLHTERKP